MTVSLLEEDVERLVAASPYEERVRLLLSDDGPSGDRTNCHGTLLYVIQYGGIELLCNVPPLIMEYIFSNHCDEGKAPHGFVSFYVEEGSRLIHSALLLGGVDGEDMMFHQRGTAGPFGVMNVEEYLSRYENKDVRHRFYHLKE